VAAIRSALAGFQDVCSAAGSAAGSAATSELREGDAASQFASALLAMDAASRRNVAAVCATLPVADKALVSALSSLGTRLALVPGVSVFLKHALSQLRLARRFGVLAQLALVLPVPVLAAVVRGIREGGAEATDEALAAALVFQDAVLGAQHTPSTFLRVLPPLVRFLQGLTEALQAGGGRSWKHPAALSVVFTCRCLLAQHASVSATFDALAHAVHDLDAAAAAISPALTNGDDDSDKDKDKDKDNGKDEAATLGALPADVSVSQRLHELAWTAAPDDSVLPWIDGAFTLAPSSNGTLRIMSTSESAATPVTGSMTGSMAKGVRVDAVARQVPAGVELVGHWNKHDESDDAPPLVKDEWKCPSCTVRNHGEATRCGTCGTAAPPPKYIHRFDAPAPCFARFSETQAAFAGQWARGPASGGWLGVRANQTTEFDAQLRGAPTEAVPVLTLAPSSADGLHAFVSIHSLYVVFVV